MEVKLPSKCASQPIIHYMFWSNPASMRVCIILAITLAVVHVEALSLEHLGASQRHRGHGGARNTLDAIPRLNSAFAKRQYDQGLDLPDDDYESILLQAASVYPHGSPRTPLAQRIQKIIDDIKIAESYTSLPKKRVMVKRNNDNVMRKKPKSKSKSSKGRPPGDQGLLLKGQKVSSSRKQKQSKISGKKGNLTPAATNILEPKASRKHKKPKVSKNVNAEIAAIMKKVKGMPKVRKPRNVDVDDLLEDEQMADELVLPDEEILDQQPLDGETDTDVEPWLRKEYYMNLARTMAISKRRKRSVYGEEDDVENLIPDDDTLGAVDMEEFVEAEVEDEPAEQAKVEFEQPEATNSPPEVTGKFETADVLPVLEDDIGDEEADEDDNHEGRTKRSSPSFFGKIDYSVPSAPRAVKFSDIDTKLRQIEEALLNEALDIVKLEEEGESRSDIDEMIANRYEAAYDLEEMRLALEDLRDKIKRLEAESDSTDDSDIRPDQECPALVTLTSSCSILKDASIFLRPEMIDACNWHEVCYTCGHAYGLEADDCDNGFAEQVGASCGASDNCDTLSSLLLSQLQPTRAFYKRKVPKTCSANKCIRSYLDLSERRR
ncbi:hypothetical protein HDE_10232 [Halotydeus destructor]|nr:hypothetical protein HDE_10232 [Halotydeus destructor]